MHFKENRKYFNNRVCHYYVDNLIKAEKLDIKNILINQENIKDLLIHFAGYDL